MTTIPHARDVVRGLGTANLPPLAGFRACVCCVVGRLVETTKRGSLNEFVLQRRFCLRSKSCYKKTNR